MYACSHCLGMQKLSAGLFTWILGQILNEILSLLFSMDKDHPQYHRYLELEWATGIIQLNLLIPQRREVRPGDLFWPEAHCPSTLSPSQRVSAGSTQRHWRWPPHTLSSVPPGTQNKAAWVGVETGSIAIIYFNGPLYFITKEWMYLLPSVVGPMLWKLRSTKQTPFVKYAFFSY